MILEEEANVEYLINYIKLKEFEINNNFLGNYLFLFNVQFTRGNFNGSTGNNYTKKNPT